MDRKVSILLVSLAIIAALVWLWFWRTRQQIYSETTYPLPPESKVGIAKPQTIPMFSEPASGNPQTR